MQRHGRHRRHRTHSKHGIRGLILAAATTAALAAPLTGCSDDNTPASTASKAASAASKAASAASKAASAASAAGDALASATAEAGRKFDEFKNGVNAKGDVKLDSEVTTDSGGRSTVKLTVTNSASSEKSYAVQVDFRDEDGNLLDTVVVTLNDVAAGASKDATARSTRTLSGHVTADVARAVRK
ncbi:FxLYD domain-containing protein [Streptomyces sp. NPDC001530]|uniref:FxLYD domain-containing protein n=1 Tax=Streptomyces sp. NPDC001530 TaxID=3364582 RepID=UPI0036AACE41